MVFEWDGKKAVANEKKHHVSFKEAATVFGDPLAITFSDPDHSKGEHRFITFGMSMHGKLLLVAHTDQKDRIRIISARRVKRHERKIYEEG